MKFYLETDRLILRDIRLSDVEGMFELDNNPIVHKYLGNKPVSTKEESAKIIKMIIDQYSKRGIGRLALIEKDSGDFIGWSGLKLNTEETINGFNDFIDIGYRLIPRYWGKGYATESSLAALEYGFIKMNLDAVYGITMLGNQASHNVLLKIGLQHLENFHYPKEDLMLRWYKLKREDYDKKRMS